jgi:hypothetical protein
MKTLHPCRYLAAVLAIGAASLAGCKDKVVIQTETVYAEQSTETNEPETPSVSEEKEARSVSKGESAPAPASNSPLLAQAAAAEPTTAEPKPKTNDAAPATRPKADRTPRKPGDPIRITFDNIILGMQADMVFRPWMLNDDVKDLDGQKVSITGVINGIGIPKQENLKEFVLLRNKECKFGKGGQADHLAKVQLKKGEAIDYTHETVRVEGTLRIKPETGEDGNTWSLYILEDATAKLQK